MSSPCTVTVFRAPKTWPRFVLLARAAVLFGLVILLAEAAFAGPSPHLGTRWDRLKVGSQVFDQVVVRDVTPRTVVILHANGLASVKLRDLEPELQQLFGYDPVAEAEAERQAELERRAIEARAVRLRLARERERSSASASHFDQLLQRMAEPPQLAAYVDLRPQFAELALAVKDQGRRPSCAVFAIVSALEFQNAQLAGRPEKLSEEYLVWATRRVTQRVPVLAPADGMDEGAAGDEADEGFSLSEVVAALRSYGIPLQASMPNTFGTHMTAIGEPPGAVIDEARVRRRVYVHPLVSRSPGEQLADMIHALNAGVPIPVGLRWPLHRTARSGYLNEQKPTQGYAHAVTVVGYECRSGRMEDTVFIFKNSYGVRWGQGGYGRVTFRYLREHLLAAVLLEVQRADS